MIAWGGSPFGAAIGGVLAEVTTMRTPFLIMDVGVALSVILAWLSPLHERTMVRDLTHITSG